MLDGGDDLVLIPEAQSYYMDVRKNIATKLRECAYDRWDGIEFTLGRQGLGTHPLNG